MAASKMKRRLCRGFTLIELLVVISIIALLLSIILPALRKVKERGRRLVCASNQKQIMTMVFMYTQENNDILPHIIHDSHTEARNMLIFDSPADLVAKYKGHCGLGLLINAGMMDETSMDVYLCPSSDRKVPPRDGFGMSHTDYFWRYQLPTAAANGPWIKLINVKPRSTVLLSDPMGLHGEKSWGHKFFHEDGLNTARADMSLSWYRDEKHLIRDAFERDGGLGLPPNKFVDILLPYMDKNKPFLSDK